MFGGLGADEFRCYSVQDSVEDFEEEGDIILGECEEIKGVQELLKEEPIIADERPDYDDMNATTTNSTTDGGDGGGGESDDDEKKPADEQETEATTPPPSPPAPPSGEDSSVEEQQQ
jgi:hypothetical protein